MTKCVLFAILIFALASLASSFTSYHYKARTTTTTAQVPHKIYKREALPEPYPYKPTTTTTTTTTTRPSPYKKYHKREALPEPYPYKPTTTTTTTTTPSPYKMYHKREALPEPYPQYVFDALLKDHPFKPILSRSGMVPTGSGTGIRYKRNAQGGFIEGQANVKCPFCYY